MKSESKNTEGACVKCGTCNAVCPVYSATGNEILAPRGKQHLRSRLEKGEASSHYADIMSKCLLCGACHEVCPMGLDTPELVISVRSELPRLSGLSFLKYVSRKALLHPPLLTGLTRLGATANTLLGGWLPQDSGLRLRLHGFERKLFKLPAAGYIEKIKTGLHNEIAQQKSRMQPGMSLFTGCLANHLQPEIAEATQVLLTKTTGSEADVPLEQTCCGMAALAAGRTGEARDLAKKNIMTFEANDLPILTSCSSCYYQLKSYKELLGEDRKWRERAARFTERLREFSTYFLQEFRSGGETFNPDAATDSRKVFYHDPCHLRFTLHITGEPRDLIRLLPGVDLQELPNGPQCCGQGGLFQMAHPELARKVQEKLLDEYCELSAQTVLTACSGCLLQWQQSLAGTENRGRAEHLAIFIARHLR